MTGDEPEWLRNHVRYRYVRQAALALLPWVDRAALREIYQTARRRGMVVDHVVPLCHPDVCGLTVPWNLRIIPAGPNAAKGNKWNPDQLDAFGEEIEPHQLRFRVL